MQGLRIAIAGCGPAGLAGALALSRAGHDVQLFDQFDEPRPLGSGLMMQPTGMAVLDWLGLGDRLRGLGAPIDRLFGREIHSRRIVLDVRYDALGLGLKGLAVHRAALFHVLYDAVKAANLAITTNCKIRHFSDLRGFDLVVDALGSRSPLMDEAAAPVRRMQLPYGAIWSSLSWPKGMFDEHTLEQRYDGASVMIGVLPIGRRREGDLSQTAFFWSLKTEAFPIWQASELNQWKRRVLALWPETEVLLKEIASKEQMVLASYAHHTLPLPYGKGIVFIGDSAHAASPQLGQGANMALLDVAALTFALQHHDSIDRALVAYAECRRRHIRIYQALSAVFTPFYQSDSSVLPFLRDWLVSPMSQMPGVPRLLATVVAGLLGRPLSRLGLE